MVCGAFLVVHEVYEVEVDISFDVERFAKCISYLAFENRVLRNLFINMVGSSNRGDFWA